MKLPPLLAPERAAHASLEGYLYQSWLAVEAWLALAEGELLRCEGDEDLDRFLLDGSAESLQVKSLTGSVNLRSEVVKGTLRRFAVSHHLLRTREEPERRRFVFIATAERRRQRTGEDGIDLLESWEAAREDSGVREHVVAALRRLLPWDEPTAGEKGKHRFWSQHHNALTWLDEDPERWADLLRSVEWRLGEPRRQEVQARVEQELAARGVSLPADLGLRLLGRVLEASASPVVENRLLDRAELDRLLASADEELARWAASPRGRRLGAAVSEVEALSKLLNSGQLRREKEDLASLPPAKLLVAGLELIPFDEAGREDILTDLATWCAAEPRCRVRLVHGEGGSGKSRLLLEWCHRLEAQGWVPGFVQRALTESELPELLAGTLPRLLVVDYAATRPRAVEALLDRLAEAAGLPKVRLVLLERRAGAWWEELRRPDHRMFLFDASTNAQPLSHLYDDLASRRRAYESCRAVFAEARGRDPLAQEVVVSMAPDLTEDAFGRPLYLQLAALAAAEGDAAATAAEALGKVLERERDFWRNSVARLHLDEEASREVRKALERAVTVLSLMGGAATEERGMAVAAGALPRGAPATRIETLARELRRLYGPTAGSEHWLDPLEPDLLGERLVAEVLARQSELLEVAVRCGDRAEHRHLLTVLGRLADRGVAGAREWRERLLEQHLEVLAPAALDVAIGDSGLAGWLEGHLRQGASAVACRCVADLLAEDAWSSSLPLQPLAIAAGQQVLGVLRETRPGPVVRWWRRRLPRELDVAASSEEAGLLNNLGNWLSALGRREAALAATKEAVGLRRRLAAWRPDAFLPSLAQTLNNLGNRLSELGRREDALAATEEAVQLRRRLAASQPDAFLPDLAGSLNNLGIRLSDLGRREDALAATEEAVQLRRRLAASQPDAFLPDLAMSVNNLGVDLSVLGRREDALRATQEAVECYRRLAASRPDSFLPDLAKSLNNLGATLGDLGRREEALAATEEAVQLGRRLAVSERDAFLPDLARSLNNLGNRLSTLGRREEALAATEEAAESYRWLAVARPGAFLPRLATSLNNLGAMLSDLGREEEALAATEEAVEIRRRLAASLPDAFLPDLATSLSNLGIRLSALVRREEALAATEESVELRRRLAASRPGAFLPDLAASLNNLGANLSDLGRHEEALVATEEALAIRRRLTVSRPDVFLPELARNLGVRSIILRRLGRPRDAVASAEEGLRVLLPSLQHYPEALAGRGQLLRYEYIAACEQAGSTHDSDFLRQIDAALAAGAGRV